MKKKGKIDVHGISIRGPRHERNHDHFAIAELAKSMKVHQSNLSIGDDTRVHGQTQGQVYLIADGISAGVEPARASSQAIDRVVQYFLNEMPWYHLAEGQPEDVTLALEDAVRNAQDDLFLGRRNKELDVLTTLTLAFVAWPDLYVAHLGRSRCYVYRDGALRLLTTPHPLASLADRAPEVQRFGLEIGDVLTLCSDGAAETHEPEELLQILSSKRDAEAMCGELVRTTGPDDRTAIVVRFLPLEPTVSALPSTAPPGMLATHRGQPPHPRPAVKTPRAGSPQAFRPFSVAG